MKRIGLLTSGGDCQALNAENEKSIGFGDGGTDVYGADCMWQRF